MNCVRIILVSLLIFIKIQIVVTEMFESELMNRLVHPSVYNLRERPGRTEGISTEVNVAIYINGISTVSELTMDFTASLFFRQIWRDSRLAFDNVTDIDFDLMTLNYHYVDDIWLPDIYIKNEIMTGTKHEISVPNIMLTVGSDGTIFYSQRLTITLACMMQLQRFPLDRQKCSISLESYGHSTKDIIVQWYNVSEALTIAPDVELPEFDLSSNDVSDCTLYYTTGNYTGAWSCASADFVMQRRFAFYLIQVYIPSIMIVILSWVSFWIDIHAVPARVTLGLLTVLTITTQSSGISQNLPRVSYIKAIDVWMFICMVFVFGALVEYSIVNVLARRHLLNQQRLAKKRQKGTLNDQHERTVVDITEAVELSNGDVTAKLPSNDEQTLKEPEITKPDRGRCCGQYRCGVTSWLKLHTNDKALMTDVISRFIFPAAFIAFNGFYWSYYYFEAKFDDDFD